MDTELIDRIKLLGMTYDIQGRLINIGKLYGYIMEDGRIRFIDTVKMEPLTEEYFRLDYLDDNIAVISHNDKYFRHKTFIINITTFDIIHNTNYYVFNELDLLIEIPDDFSRDIKELSIINKDIDRLYSFNASNKVVLTALNNKGLYLLRYEVARDNDEDHIRIGDYRYFEILQYNENSIKSLYKSCDYTLDVVNEGVIMFSSFEDFTEIYVYDFNKMCMISKNNI